LAAHQPQQRRCTKTTLPTLLLFEQDLTNLIWVRIGKPFAQLITINFEDIEDKAVCAIVVNKAEQNALYKSKSKKTFYVRTNCTTREINDLEEFGYYLQEKALAQDAQS